MGCFICSPLRALLAIADDDQPRPLRPGLRESLDKQVESLDPVQPTDGADDEIIGAGAHIAAQRGHRRRVQAVVRPHPVADDVDFATEVRGDGPALPFADADSRVVAMEGLGPV